MIARHHVNAAPIYLTINSQPWISNETKARLLEWKIRMDLVEYASRGAPPLLPISEIAAYQPRKPQSAPGTDPVAGKYFARIADPKSPFSESRIMSS